MDSKKIYVQTSRGKGRGVFVSRKIKKGEVVAEYDGPIYEWEYPHWNHDLYHHTIQFAPRRWRDCLGVARLINHSCEPNCGIKKLFQVVAMRDIEVGEEITWDYEMTEDHPRWRMKCQCGTVSCRGKIGAYRNMPLATRRKYRGYVSAWLVKKYGRP